MYIEPTEFKDIRTGNINIGVRCYDDYACFYTDWWATVPVDDLEILKKCLEDFYFVDGQMTTKDCYGFFGWIKENHCGIYIGGTYYKWEQIAPFFEQKTSLDPKS